MTGAGDELLHTSLLRLARDPRPWADLEAEQADRWPGVHLGGDPLRPYAVRARCGRVAVTAVRRAGLPDPPLIADLLGGRYGPPAVGSCGEERGGVHYPQAEVVRLTVAGTFALSARLAVPDVLLVGLGDRDRYRGARLPLGVARLASWLRFTHASRVEVIDYTLHPDPVGLIAEALLGRRPGVVGVGVNFGQWPLLADLAELLEQATASWEIPPVVVLGNILAAFSPEEATKPFKRAAAQGRVLVATGLGERPLEGLCRSLDTPEAWPGIEGLTLPSATGNPDSAPDAGVPGRPGRMETGHVLHLSSAPSLVAPDDSLVLAVAAEGGQVSLETSLGCQYGACTFCPRQHKGQGWLRGEDGVCVAILERFSRLRSPGGCEGGAVTGRRGVLRG